MMFQRKLLVAAVAGALGAGATGAALAQTTVGNVQIYGRLYPEFTVAKSSGATAGGASSSTLGRAPFAAGAGDLKSRNSVDASNSRIGFRGTENLGGGLSAIWQIETQVALDSGASGMLASRRSFVGLRGGFGTVRLGNMDTVYKDIGDPLGILGISSGNFVSMSNVISSRVPFGTSSAGSFHLRRASSIFYDSPNFGGLQLHAQYGPDEIRTGNLDADLWSVGAVYKRGALEASLAHEIHNDLFAGSNGAPAVANPTAGAGGVHSKDRSTRLMVLYNFASKAKVQVNVATVEYTESGGAAGKFEEYKNNRWSLTWEQQWTGPWRTTVAYGNSSEGSCSLVGGAACTTNGLGGNMLTLGADYSFSRRTKLFLLYAKLNNRDAAQLRNLENVSASQVAPGTDIAQYALGIRHDF